MADFTSESPDKIRAAVAASTNVALIAAHRVRQGSLRTLRAGDVDGPFGHVVPGGGLIKHERLGGHVIEKHVAMPITYLQERLRNEPLIPSASTFYDRALSERAIAQALDIRSVEIADWLASNSYKKPFKAQIPEPSSVSLVRNATVPQDARSVLVVLIKSPASATGFRVHTAYPELP